jgi:hypothetical protein
MDREVFGDINWAAPIPEIAPYMISNGFLYLTRGGLRNAFSIEHPSTYQAPAEALVRSMTANKPYMGHTPAGKLYGEYVGTNYGNALLKTLPIVFRKPSLTCSITSGHIAKTVATKAANANAVNTNCQIP